MTGIRRLFHDRIKAIQVTKTLSNRLLHSNNVRKSFGSFHSENVEELIRQSDELYRPPPVYDSMREELPASLSSVRFGPSLVSDVTLFPLDIPHWTFLNHGAFGCTLSPILRENARWREWIERQPLRFFDRELLPLIVFSLRHVAKVLGCSATDLFPLPNVTSGLNLILHSIPLERDDIIVYFNVTYGSTKKMMRHYAAERGAVALEISLQLPIVSEDDIIAQILRHISPRVRLVVIDHVTSNTALSLPIQQIARAVKSASDGRALVAVDGAHSLFSQRVQLSDLAADVDFWLTNAHKWFCAGKGAALLWLSPRLEAMTMKPLVISHGFQSSDHVSVSREHLLSSLVWDGCRDYVSLVSLPSVSRVWSILSSQRDVITGADDFQPFRLYIRQVLEEAEEMLTRRWRLRPDDFLSSKEFRRDCPMRLVSADVTLLGLSHQ